MKAFVFHALFLCILFSYTPIFGQTGCENLPCANDPLGNGPTPCESKLYCSNSEAVDNGFIACTPSADTDGCGIEASVSAQPTGGTLSLLQNTACFQSGDNVQWIRYMTDDYINQVQLQGSGQTEGWAVFWAPNWDYNTDPTASSSDYCDDPLNDLEFIYCTNANQWKTFTNENSTNEKNLYYIALLYSEPSEGTINFKSKKCKYICFPSLTCANDLTVECDDQVGISNWLNNYSYNDCGQGLHVVNDYNPTHFNGCGGSGSQTITFDLVDAHGNVVKTCTTNLTVNPPGLPTIHCPAYNDISCADVDNFDPIPIHYTGECGLSGTLHGTVTNENYDGCDGGYITITYSGYDDCGRYLSKNCHVQISGIILPTIHCPVYNDYSCADVEHFEPDPIHVYGDCGYSLTLHGTVTHENYDACNGGYITITYSGDDSCGNHRSKNCHVQVSGANLPTIHCPAYNDYSCADVHTFEPIPAPYSGDCGLSGTVEGQVTDSEYDACNGGTLTITYSGYDSCGRYISKDCEIQLSGIILPELYCPNLPPLTCEEASDYHPDPFLITGDCGYEINLHGVVTIENYNPCVGGKIVVTYSGIDNCGNHRSIDCEVSVKGAGTPVIVCPHLPDISCVDADHYNPPSVDYDGGCGNSGTLHGMIKHRNYDCNGGYITVAYWGYDECGTVLDVMCHVTVTGASYPELINPITHPISCEDVDTWTPPDLHYTGECGVSGTIVGTRWYHLDDYDPCTGGTIYVKYWGMDDCFPSLDLDVIVEVTGGCCPPDLCSYTIGYWGNHRDHLDYLLNGGAISIGNINMDGDCLDALLPGQPHNSGAYCPAGTYASSQVRQTIGLTLNVLNEPSLCYVKLTDACVANPSHYGLPHSATVCDLLDAANKNIMEHGSNYTGALTAVNECYDTCPAFNFDPTEIFSFDLTLKPNPSYDLTVLNFNSNNEGPMQVMVFDLAGMEIYNQSFDAEKGPNQTVLDVHDWKQGMYLVNVVSTTGRVYSTKFVKVTL